MVDFKGKLFIMKTRRKLLPGQAGTKKLLQKYGNNLDCVRYRYDEKQKRRVTTVEIIVDEVPWQPNPAIISFNKTVDIRVGYNEIYIRNLGKTKYPNLI